MRELTIKGGMRGGKYLGFLTTIKKQFEENEFIEILVIGATESRIKTITSDLKTHMGIIIESRKSYPTTWVARGIYMVPAFDYSNGPNGYYIKLKRN